MNLHGKTALVTGSTSGIGLGSPVLAQAPSWCSMASATAATPAEVAALGKIPGYHDADLRDVGQIGGDDALCRKHLRRRRYRDQ
ncbi:hypothetical protein [Klebsiella pneumoniae]|uniref:hypothetical protein n=1 Tax=Klebsiella pneumoniae TaxID=573 RepID=UPI001A160F8C|nr:hypothetical protein KPZU02_51600 [Klebsiella pneumoniae]